MHVRLLAGLARRITTPLLYVPLALLTWVLMHESGVHATVAGGPRDAHPNQGGPGEQERRPRRLRTACTRCPPGSACRCSFFAAGVDLRGQSLVDAFESPGRAGVMLGLVIGKPIGVLLGAGLSTHGSPGPRQGPVSWMDVVAVGLLAGIGFTVSLLITELAFGYGSPTTSIGKIAVLSASVIAAGLAIIALRIRARAYRAMHEEEERDDDQDGIPDVYRDQPPLP